MANCVRFGRSTQLWQQHPDPAEFVKAARGLGYDIAAGEDRRPYKVITPDGANLDLVRQITTAKTKDVAERLNPIRQELWTEKEALKLVKEQQQEQVKQQAAAAKAKEQAQAQAAADARAKAAEQKAQKRAQEAAEEVKPYQPSQQPERLPEPAPNRIKALSDLAQFKTNAAATKAEQTAQKLPEKQPEKPQPAPPIDEKANRLHQLGQFKASAPQPPQKAAEQERLATIDNQSIPPKLPPTANDNQKPKEPQTEKERFEAKLKEMREREEETRREIERRAQLTDEQRKAEDKARFEVKLKEMQEQQKGKTRQQERGFER